jgi:hypothetical protein
VPVFLLDLVLLLLLLLLPRHNPTCSINAYFTYSVVGFYGTGMITNQQALAAFVNGWLFILLSLSGGAACFGLHHARLVAVPLVLCFCPFLSSSMGI